MKINFFHIKILALFILLNIPCGAFALTYTFSDRDYINGASWGKMTISIFDYNTLMIRYDASTAATLGSQATGFGFSFLPNTIIPSSIDNTPYVAGSRSDLKWIMLNNLNALPNPANGDEFNPAVKKEDFFFGATEGNANNINPPGIKPGEFDVFYLNFGSSAPSFTATTFQLDKFVEFAGVRFQSLPNNINGGSLYLVGAPEKVVPEPGTIVLCGIGLLSLTILRKRCKRK